jgi:hypothetical protein
MGLVPIILDYHREQVCEVSIHSLEPFSSYGDTCLHAKTEPRISKSKKWHYYAKKQIRVMGLVLIIFDDHREQVCEVSILSLQ